MKNSYLLEPAKVIKAIKESPTAVTLFFKMENQKNFGFLAGQFMQISLPGFGECPISISSNPKDAGRHFSLTIRGAGDLTRRLNKLQRGDTTFVRGPFGNGFPEVTGNLVLISGGCGLAPLRSVYLENKNKKNVKIQIFHGCRDASQIVFHDEFDSICENCDFNVILEKDKLPGYSDQTGFVTNLIKNKKLLPDAKIFMCGPEAMYKNVVKELIAKGVKPEDIYVSLENRMHCGVGVCQHCACKTKYVCKDGPVFNYAKLCET
ncbi:MAG: FAD/NAD(P)-binding protein [Parcubacteria group bacterium]